MFILLLIKIRCRWCGLIFYICRPCFRGQAYCSDPCRKVAKQKIKRRAQKKYRGTDKGKKTHCKAENRRRQGLSKKNQKNMDDPTSTVLPAWVMELLCRLWSRIFYPKQISYCHFCGCPGQIVNQFPRRGYDQGRKE